MKKLILLLLIGMIAFHSESQTAVDALRYSYLLHGGTARYVAMSGAFGALGADFSSISTNPAGIGSFRTSSFMLSPIVQLNTSESLYLDELTKKDKISVNINNIGFIMNLVSPEEESMGWKSVGFAIGYNKLKSFNNDISTKAYNTRSSLLDQFMLNSDGIDPYDLYSAEWVAFDTYLTDTIPGDELGRYIHQYYNNYYLNQNKKTSISGGVGEYVFAIGGNYNDMLQVGISMGIQSIRYIENSSFTESSDSTDLQSYTFEEYLSTSGTGFNLKIGFIYRPVNFLRIGVAFHTPTFFTMKDIYSYSMTSNFRTPDIYNETQYYSDDGGEKEYSYELYTPMRLATSLAFVFPKIGILSADYEYVKYNKASFRAEEDDFTETNEEINEIYQSGHNIRIGGEIKLAPMYIRGGVSYYSSPDKAGDYGITTGYSFGTGIRTQKVFVDFAFNHFSNNLNYRLYDYESGTEWAKQNFNNDMICVTFGYVF